MLTDFRRSTGFSLCYPSPQTKNHKKSKLTDWYHCTQKVKQDQYQRLVLKKKLVWKRPVSLHSKGHTRQQTAGARRRQKDFFRLTWYAKILRRKSKNISFGFFRKIHRFPQSSPYLQTLSTHRSKGHIAGARHCTCLTAGLARIHLACQLTDALLRHGLFIAIKR